jgi:hypothetical protein
MATNYAEDTWYYDNEMGVGYALHPDQVNLFDSTSNNFYLTGVQLEVGDTATPFEHRSYGEELSLCQRYFFTTYEESNLAVGATSYNGSISSHRNTPAGTATGTMNIDVSLPVSMRDAPTVTIYNPATGASGSGRTTGGANVSTLANPYTLSNNFVSVYNSGAMENAASYLRFHLTAESEL